MIGTLLLIYAIGAVIVFLLGLSQIGSEPTAHGQIIMMQYLIAGTLLWPLAVPFLIFCWAYYQVTGKALGD